MLRRAMIVLSALTLAVGAAGPASAANMSLTADYYVYDIGTAGGSNGTYGYSLSNGGANSYVAGWTSTPAGGSGFYWSFTTGVQTFGSTANWSTTPAKLDFQSSKSVVNQAYGVNNQGTVVGEYGGSAFSYRPGTDSGPVAVTGGTATVLYSISDANTPSTSYPYGLAVGDTDATGKTGYTYDLNTGTYTSVTKACLNVNDSGRWAGTGAGYGTSSWLAANGTSIETSSSAYWFQGIDSTSTYLAGQNETDTPGGPILCKLNSTGTSIASTVSTKPAGDSTFGETQYTSVNSNGWAVGGDESQITGSSRQASVWTGNASGPYIINTTNFPNLIGELGVVPSNITFEVATGINDAGDMLVWGLPSGSTYYHTYFISPTLLVVPGDANKDDRVDINDLTIVLTNYGQSGMIWSQGDFNGDHQVDINDLTVVLTNYGYGVTAAGIKAVPEPGTLALVAAGLAGLLAYAWRKHR